MKKSLLSVFLFGLVQMSGAQTFPVVYDFTSTSDSNNLYTGSLHRGATLETLGDYGVLNLGSSEGYFELGADFGSMIQNIGSSFSISVDVFVPVSTNIGDNGNFVWCFSKSSSQGYMFFSAKDTRYAITQTSWTSESSVSASSSLPKGRWVNIIYVQDGSEGNVYLDNVNKASSNVWLSPSSLSDLTNNYLGRSCYSGDAFLKDARYADFRIYNKALGESERKALSDVADGLNRIELGIETDEDAVDYDIANLYMPKVVYKSVQLPVVGEYGTSVVWTSSDRSYLTDDGVVVKQETDRDVPVVLTAVFRLGTVEKTMEYELLVKKVEDYQHYLFAFFPSNSNENIYYAVSEDGYNYTTINNDQAVLLAQGNTVMGGFRDPHILRGEDGWLYMVATDMRSALGWASNRGMVLMKSPDLINWTCSKVHFPTRFAGTYLENVTRVWAPETIYDKKSGKYMIYFSILTSDGRVNYDKVFYCYANSDFTDLESEPVYFYDRGSATIDMDIVYNEADGLYHAFYKNEGSGGICKVIATSLTPDAGMADGSQWSSPSGTLQQTSVAVEGAGVFRLINDDKWVLMYDCYGSGYYQFCTSPDLSNFTLTAQTNTSGSFTPRHGTVLPITQAEYDALLKVFPCEGLSEEPLTDEDGNLNLTSERIPRLTENTSGWTSLSGFNVLESSANYANGEARVNGSFIERWRRGRTIGQNEAVKTLKYLPCGQYKLTASCIASWQNDPSVTVDGVTLYVDDQTADVHTANEKPELYTLYFDIDETDGYTTSLGVRTSSSTNANWVAFDNFHLYYVGTQEEYRIAMRNMHLDYISRAEALYAYLTDERLSELQQAVDSVDPDETDIDKVNSQLDRLLAAMEKAQNQISTSVISVEDDSGDSLHDGACYDLTGRKINVPERGIYIINNKKVVK